MGRFIRRFVKFSSLRMSTVLLFWSVGFCAFLYGYLSSEARWFPHSILLDARNALPVLRAKLNANRVPEEPTRTDFSVAEGARRRVVVKEPGDDGSAFLMTGGVGQYLEYCPEYGCAAVILRRDGSLVHAYPYRPDELTGKRSLELPYAEFMHDDAKDTTVFGLAPLPIGDLIVVYDFKHTTPNGGGIARMDKDGHVLWYRRDYSNHWPAITDSNKILVISHTIGSSQEPISPNGKFSFDCPTGVLADVVRVLDENGSMNEEIPVFEALRNSKYWPYLHTSQDSAFMQREPCDPVHANSVREVGVELAAKLENLQPDDLILSLRNISALAIIGRRDYEIKYLFKGTFLFQHSAQIVPGGTVILFDNYGSSASGGPSRVLGYDPVTKLEHIVFPNADTPSDVDTFSPIKGNINVSKDGTRALVAVTMTGRAYEIRLSDGKILTSFDNLHDVSSFPVYENNPRIERYFPQHGIFYVYPELLSHFSGEGGS